MLFLIALGVGLWAHHEVVWAANFQDVLNSVDDKIELENYQTTVHADAPNQSGVKNIASAIFFAIDFVKYVLGSIAVLMLMFNAIRMITAGKESEDAVKKEKDFLKYALMGLVLVFVADEAILLAFFGEEGEVLTTEESAADYASAGGDILEGLYNFVHVFMASIAVLMLVYSGLQILMAAGSEETVNSAKKRIFISSMGLVVVGLSELFVKDIFFKDQGSEIDVDRGRELLVSLTNFLASVIGTIAVGALVYAGFLYILNFGNEDMVGKAKKIMFGAVAGIILAAGAFAVVSTVIPVEGAL